MITVINESSTRISKVFLKKWLRRVHLELKKKKIKSRLNECDLSLVFVTKQKSKKLNKKYRKKNKPTDILSFGSLKVSSRNGELPELVICSDIVRLQAKENKHSFQNELGYLILHGVLHLLGYDHEKSKVQAAQMFRLQDAVFEELRG